MALSPGVLFKRRRSWRESGLSDALSGPVRHRQAARRVLRGSPPRRGGGSVGEQAAMSTHDDGAYREVDQACERLTSLLESVQSDCLWDGYTTTPDTKAE